MVFVNVLLPVLLVVSIGFLAQRIFKWDLAPLAEAALYVLVPALIFQSLYQTNLNLRQLTVIVTHALLLATMLTVVAIALSRLIGYPGEMERALVLGSSFKNTGNYGLSVLQFALGSQAVAVGTPFFVTEIFLMYTLGVFIAAGGQNNWRKTTLTIAKMPPLYAMLAAGLFRRLEVQPPHFLWQAVGLLAAAAIPVMLLSLGAQLAGSKVTGISGPVVLGTAIRLLLSPLLAYGLASLMGVDPFITLALTLMAATPSGVVTTLFAIEYNTAPELVAMMTVTSTALSFITISLLLGYLL